SARVENGSGHASGVRQAIAAVRGIAVEQVAAQSTIQGELGFDSLLLTELLEAIEVRFGAVDAQRLQSCVTVADVETLVGASGAPSLASPSPRPPPDASVRLPEPVQQIGRAVVGKLQDFFYGEVMKPRVYGRAHIPHNRNVIVVANHASHLDM